MPSTGSNSHSHPFQGKQTGSIGHQHTVPSYPADSLTDAEVAALRALIAVPTPELVPEPTPGTNPSGQAPLPPVAAFPNRLLIDDFTTPAAEGQFLTAYAGKFTAYPYGWLDTSKIGMYDPGIISAHDSVLDMHLRQIGGTWRVAGPEPVVMSRTQGRTNVRITVRFKADPVQGFKTAWLLWPMSNVWPRDGEIDFPEGDLHGGISAFMHRQGATDTSGADQDYRGTGVNFTSWHTAVTEWVAGQFCAFYMDGTLLGFITSRVPSTPMRCVLQTETWMGHGAPPAGASAHVLLDWITVDGK